MKPKESDLKLAKQIKVDLQKKLGDQLLAVYLYGSRARGTARPDSDMDLFLLLKRVAKFNSREEEIIDDIAYKYLNSKNILVVPISYSLSQMKRYGNLSYMKEVRKGVKL